MQRVPNNGSFLQSYSLMKNIQELGHDVEFIDYIPGEVLIENETVKESKINSVLDKIKKHFLFPRKRKNEVNNAEFDLFKQWEQEYSNYMLPILGVDKNENRYNQVDTLVIGSDEVFNCLQPNPKVGFSKQLFGEDCNANKVITYAASFGNTSETGLKKYGIYDVISSYLSNLSAISVRDRNSLQLVEKMVGLIPEYHVDPVFLYDYEDEVKNLSVKENGYIVVYAYSRRINQKEASEIINFAKKNNKKIICLAGVQEFFGEFVKCNPFETLAYIKNADYVVTDTFHGTVFSIKYNKKFVTIVRNGEGKTYGNSNKLVDLLARFNLLDRVWNNKLNLENVLNKEIAYEEINRQIEKERVQSIDYLKNNI